MKTCPSCGAPLERKPGSVRWFCPACGWTDVLQQTNQGSPEGLAQRLVGKNPTKDYQGMLRNLNKAWEQGSSGGGGVGGGIGSILKLLI